MCDLRGPSYWTSIVGVSSCIVWSTFPLMLGLTLSVYLTGRYTGKCRWLLRGWFK